MMKLRISLSIAVLIFASVVLAGCVQQSPPESNNTLYGSPEGAPSVRIILPAEGSVLNSSTVGIMVNVTNFRLLGIELNRSNVKNSGHMHFFLDGVEKMSSITSVSYTDIPAGDHTLRVELRNNDHTPLGTLTHETDTVHFKTA